MDVLQESFIEYYKKWGTEFSKEEIIKKITDKTRAIMISNPGNPTDVVYTPEELRMLGDIVKEHDLYLIGAAALKDTPDSYFTETKAEYQRRRDIMMEGLLSIPGVICKKPTGAFYIVAKLPVEDAEDFAKFLLTDFNHDGKTIMVAPAGGFYATSGLGKDEIRLSYCLNCEALKDAMDLLKMAVVQYKEAHK